MRAVATATTGRSERRSMTLHRPEDSAHRDVLRRLGQGVAARRSSLGGAEPSPLERQQDLLEVALGNLLALSDLLDRYEDTVVVEGEIQHRRDRVLTPRRDAHGPPSGQLTV